MPAPSPARRPRPSPAVLAGGTLLLVVLAIGVVSLTGRVAKREIQDPSASTLAASRTAAPSAVVTGSGGTLVVDALPWGELVAITDGNGAKQSLDPGSRYTPVAVRLPPGEYTIEVRNPSFPQPVTLRAAIASGKVETRVAEFRRVDAAAYFRRVGLQP